MIRVSDHAIDRYIERVKPCLEPEQAKAEILRLFDEVVGFRDTPPDWHDPGKVPPFERYAMVGDGIAFGMKGLVVVTTLARGGHSDEVREARNRRHAGRRGKARAHRNKRRDAWRTKQDRARDGYADTA